MATALGIELKDAKLTAVVMQTIRNAPPVVVTR